MPPQTSPNQNLGGYQGTGKYGVFDGNTYNPPSPGNPYGSVTYGKTTPENQVIVTGSKPAADFAQNSQYIQNLINNKSLAGIPPPTINPQNGSDKTQVNPNDPNNIATFSDPYTQMLDKISATSDKATQNLIATIKAQKANQTNTINQDADRLKSGLMSLGIETGQINFTPDLVYGHIQQAENDRTAKLADIDQKEATALLDAQQAAENKNFTVLKEKVDYIKSLKQDQINVLKNTYDTANYESKIGSIEANQIYDEVQKLPDAKSKTDFMQAIATKFGIPLLSLTTQVNKITAGKTSKTSTKSASGAFKTSNAIAQLTPLMESKKGGDGYINPDQWVAAREKWQSQGGTESSFKSNFIKYLNPNDYKVAGYTPPKSSGRSL